jgi:GT2 family glycosyltransferase
VVEQIPFDEKNFDGFHLYDIDFTFRAYLAGMKLAVCSDISILHFSKGNYGDEWDVYGDRFNEMNRDRLAPKIEEKFSIPMYYVNSMVEARVFTENPVWGPWS